MEKVVLYVSQYCPFAYFCGAYLQAGDQIVRVNGLVLSETTHEEFLNLMKLRKTYTLTLKGTPMLPLSTLSYPVPMCSFELYCFALLNNLLIVR